LGTAGSNELFPSDSMPRHQSFPRIAGWVRYFYRESGIPDSTSAGCPSVSGRVYHIFTEPPVCSATASIPFELTAELDGPYVTESL